MLTIKTKAIVTEDGDLNVHISATSMEPGEHDVVVVMNEHPTVRLKRPFILPIHDVGPWPENLSLRREDM